MTKLARTDAVAGLQFIACTVTPASCSVLLIYAFCAHVHTNLERRPYNLPTMKYMDIAKLAPLERLLAVCSKCTLSYRVHHQLGLCSA